MDYFRGGEDNGLLKHIYSIYVLVSNGNKCLNVLLSGRLEKSSPTIVNLTQSKLNHSFPAPSPRQGFGQDQH